MLIPQNLSPDACVYVNAAYVLEVLMKRNETAPAELYCQVRSSHEMSYSMMVLCLDWLYLIGCIRMNNEKIKTVCF